MAVTLALLVSAAFAVEPVRDAATFDVIPEAHLDLSSEYVAVAPISNVLDTLTLLGVRQHIAMLVSLIVLYVAVRIWRRRSAAREGLFAILFLFAIVVTYVAGALAPRPMAALELTPAELIEYASGRVAPFKRVRAVEFVDEIPRSPSGKILRRVLVERERAAWT